FASGDTMIKVGKNGRQGTATLDFNGTPGTYELTVAYFDETDGNSTMEVEVDGNSIDSWRFDLNLGGKSAEADNLVERTLTQSLTLDSNSNVVLKGLRNVGELARVDYIELKPVGNNNNTNNNNNNNNNNNTNTSPQAGNDSYSVLENNTLNINTANGVLSNDSDADGDNLTVSNFDNNSTSGGNVSLNNNGSFSYTPATNFTGTDSFNYTVSDGNGGTDTATVTVAVTADNNNIDNTAPTADLTVTNVTAAGGGFHTFNVTYTDDEAVDITTFDASDIFVTTPDGFDAEATFLGANSNNNTASVTASYQVDAPGNSWDDADNGTYTVVLRDDEVSDTSNNFVAGDTLGSFQVDVPELVADTTAPTTALAASDIINGGGSDYQFNVTYTDDTAVDDGTIDDSDVRVTGPGGFSQTATLVNTVTNNQGAVITATYEIDAAGGSWDDADNGNYTISLQDNQVSDTSNNFISGSNLGSFAVNISNADDTVGQYDIFEQSFSDAGNYSNPYRQVDATATFTGPNNQTADIPLFWDGGDTWKFRFSPEVKGQWSWTIDSNDAGLDGESGSFEVVNSNNKGGIEAKPDSPYYFQYEDGTPFYFFGDTNWRLGRTVPEENLNRDTVLDYLDTRASQGFNYIHADFGEDPNEGGNLWEGTKGRDLNPGYFQELDRRIEYMNDLGITTGYMLEWAQGWRNDFSSQADRLQYAEYVTARYSAHNVVFIVSGEYNETLNASNYREIGQHIDATDPHDRMITIHATRSSREFGDESWTDLGDYMQMYTGLHKQALISRDENKPVVNSEYAYYLRDSNGDGQVDKPNSETLEDIRHASYDIVMAGTHLVTGWGTTYFGGRRDPGPFNPNDPRNDDWEEDVQHIKTLFTDREWWELEPHDELIGGPGTEYLLADIGEEYVAYVRGNSGTYSIDLDTNQTHTYDIQRFDPREGTYTNVGTYTGNDTVTFSPPDSQDWVYILSR
ncbi:MAG: DUF4038 domain-containing protein, partial [Microcoleaceae cyanobacterium]